MPSYEETIEVEVPREEAFAYVADFTTAAEWDPGIRSSKRLDEEPTRVGSAFEVVAEFRGKPQTFRYEVLELDPDRRIVIRGESEKAISDDTITFADADGEDGDHVRLRAPAQGALSRRGALCRRDVRKDGQGRARGSRAHARLPLTHRYRPAMPEAVILSAVRTPVGRYGGGLSGVRPDDLAAVAVAAAVERSGVPAAEIEDVWLGCANQAGEDNRNVARFAALLAGLPDTVGGVTVNRLCASGLAAVVGACHAVIAGDGDLFVAGGVESMSRAPLVTPKPEAAFARGDRTLHDTTLGWRFTNPRYAERYSTASMGETGENVAAQWSVSREDQDAFALESQRRWADADAAGRFADEFVPAGELERDEHPRPETTGEKLASLKPAFAADGTVTAGNASGINDGAAALVIASAERARELGAAPLGVFRGSAVAGVDPAVMGIGPVPAVRKLLDRAGVARGRARPGRAQRGVRLAVAGRRPGARPRSGEGERQRRRDRDRPPARDVGRAPRRDAPPRAPSPRCPLRRRDDVRRRRPGPGRALRAGLSYTRRRGRLAQLGEHQLDKLGVTGSSPVAPISGKTRIDSVFPA